MRQHFFQRPNEKTNDARSIWSSCQWCGTVSILHSATNIANSPSDAGLIVVEAQNIARRHAGRRFCYHCRRFQRTQQLDWRGKVHSSLQEKHAKLVALMHTVCQKPGCKWKIPDTIEAITAEWRSAKTHRKPGQVVVLTFGGESVVTPAKAMTFIKF